ncbi:MAG: hypothetical protein ACKVZ0_25315 [Gemmatimonadales bacterium]
MSSPFRCPIPILATLAAGLVGCGGNTVSPPPPPPPPPDNTRNVAAHAGDGQRAKAGEPVAVAPAIRVTSRSAAPVAGVGVVFSIGAGNGTMAGETATTGADGVAAVGRWTLGAVGANTLIATVTGATGGSPVTFTATGEEILVLPAKDTTLSGVIRVTRFIVPAGIKVSVKDSLRIVADGAVEIAGSLEGDCTPVTIESKDDLTVKGILDNKCVDPTAAGAKLVAIGRGGYLFEGATIGSSGDVEITDDPTLVDADFGPSPSPAPAAAATAVAASHRDCTFRQSQYPRGTPSPARDGNNAPTAGDGGDGTLFKLECRGNMLVDGAVKIRGQDGGIGGTATAAPAVGFAKATGGKGGNGGKIVIRAVGNIGFAGTVEIETGKGGNGGSAEATAGVPLSGVPAAPAAEARGGAGGDPGLFTLRAKISVKFNDPTKLIIGDAGNGGNALALGRNGNAAVGAVENAQVGGAATAFGGAGGSTPPLPLKASGLVIVDGQNLTVTGGRGGVGGDGESLGGNGGRGAIPLRNGADGGAIAAFGGRGGAAGLRDHNNQLFGAGGAGGTATFAGGIGGTGISHCSLSDQPFGRGGNGGRGGAVRGTDGVGGTGLGGPAPDGGIVYQARVSNGGQAGHGTATDGSPNPGDFGFPGADMATTASVASRVVPRGFTNGPIGAGCFSISLGRIEKSFVIAGPLGPSCETGLANEVIKNLTAGAAAYQLTFNAPGFRLFQATGTVPPAPLSTSDHYANSFVPIFIFFDPCKAAPVTQGNMLLQVTIGSSTYLIQIPVDVRVTVT